MKDSSDGGDAGQSGGVDLMAAPGTDPLSESETIKLPFDVFRLLEVIRRRFLWLLLVSALVTGTVVWLFPKRPKFVAVVRLIKRDRTSPLAADRTGTLLQSQALPSVLGTFLNSGELLRRVREKSPAHLRPDELAGALKVVPADTTDVINLMIRGKRDAASTAQLANLFAAEIALFTQELEQRQAREFTQFLGETLVRLDQEFSRVNQELAGFLNRSGLFEYDKETDAYLQRLSQLDVQYQNTRIELETIDLKIKALRNEILNQKRGEINSLSLQFTDAHPILEDRRAQLANLEQQLGGDSTNSVSESDLGNPVANQLYSQIIGFRVQKIALAKEMEELHQLRERVEKKLKGFSQLGVDYALLKNRLQTIQTVRATVASRKSELELLGENSMGYYWPMATVKTEDVAVISGLQLALLAGLVAGAVIFFFGLGVVLVAELLDDRIKTSGDLQRVTRLPVLATLGDSTEMSPAEQAQWGVMTWTLLARRLTPASPGGAVFLGVIASGPGQGRSTWIRHLASAAAQRGLRVVAVDATAQSATADAAPSDHPVPAKSNWIEEADVHLVSNSAEPRFLRPPPDWTWNLAELAQWREALARWRTINQAVVLVELPSPSETRALMLVESVSQILWLCGSRMARSAELARQVENLRHANCTLVGAVLNRAPGPMRRKGLPRWLHRITFVVPLSLGLCAPLWAQDAVPGVVALEPAETETNLFFSAVSPQQRAPWQERLTLGPGDILNFSLFGFPELEENNVEIGPDGRVTFLQAQGIVATGLTVDELRAKVRNSLAKYYRNPRVVITPSGFQSKRFFILGSVARKGVFTLNRPMTIVEAVAQANGLATQTLGDHSIVEATDLSRSFLLRQGKKLTIDFERLFREGDLTQNILLAPDDYLYFPAATRNELFVLGQVNSPGILPFNPKTTLISAITQRGGFTPAAYKKKILVVRGSLKRPEGYVVDAGQILAGKAPDFRLQPKDIIFVNKNPWQIAGQIIDMAVSSYIYAVVISWAGQSITPMIDTHPYIPTL